MKLGIQLNGDQQEEDSEAMDSGYRKNNGMIKCKKI